MKVDKNNLPELPQGWVWTKMEDVADLLRGVSYAKDESSKEIKGGYVPILRANNIDSELNFDDLVYVLPKRVKHEQFVRAFDILIAMSSGSKDLVGKASQARNDFQGGFGAFCGLVRITPQLDRKFVGFYFQSQSYRNRISRLSSGVNINNLRRSHIESLSLPLPPLPEQHRIVAEIEELFTKLDVGVEALKKVKTQLERYRQSVLKSAMEGKLTKKWRETHKNEIGLPSLMLKNKIKNIYKTHRKNLPSVEDLQSHDLPEKWSYATLPYLVTNERYSIKRGPFGGSLKKEYFVSSGYKVYEQQNVIKNDFVLGNYYIDEEKFQEMKAFEINAGDVLISCSGTIGRIAIVPESYEKGIINQALLKLTLDNNIILTNFFVYLFRNFVQEEEFFTNIKGVAIKNIASIKELKKIFFKLPPLSEQHKIVEEIEKRFSIADEVEKTVEQSLKQSEILRQSILKRAFEGKLAPHDPTDEPANVLLERIKKEKERLDAERKTKRKSRKKKTKKYVKKELM